MIVYAAHSMQATAPLLLLLIAPATACRAIATESSKSGTIVRIFSIGRGYFKSPRHRALRVRLAANVARLRRIVMRSLEIARNNGS